MVAGRGLEKSSGGRASSSGIDLLRQVGTDMMVESLDEEGA